MKTLATSILAFSALALAQTATNEAQFSSAAAQLISLYLPSSALSSLQAVASSASVTGDLNSAIYSALTATSLPQWLQTAVPTQYSANIVSLESAISQIRGYASAGNISGAPRVVTSTDSVGSVVVSTSMPPSSATASSASGSSGSSTGSSAASSTPTSGFSSSLTTLTGTHSSTSTVSNPTGPSSTSSTSSSRADAAPTDRVVVGVILGVCLLGAITVC